MDVVKRGAGRARLSSLMRQETDREGEARPIRREREKEKINIDRKTK